MKQSDAYDIIGVLIDELYTNKPHAAWEHEYSTDDHLKARISVEKKDAASCFNKGIDVVGMIIDIIEDSTDVVSWIMKSKEKYLTICAEKKNCGRKFLRNREHDWNDGAIICNHVKVILGKSYDDYGYMTGIHLRTAFLV